MASIYDKASLVLIPSGTKTSKVYSQKPTNGDGDFTFSRSTAATRVNASGNIEKETQNLLLQSNNFGTTWGNTNITITGGQSDRDGGSNAWKFDINGGTAAQNVRQGVSNSGVTTFSLYLKAGTLNWSLVQVLDGGSNPAAYFDLQNGVVGNITGGAIDASIEAAGNGYYRCSVQANGNINQARIYPATADNNITQSSGYIFGQDAQLEQGLVARDYIETTTAAVEGGITDNVPRLDYQGSCPALLLEPQRTNLVTYSEYIAGLSLSSSPTLSIESETNPEGYSFVYKVTATATSSRVQKNIGTQGNNMVYSGFFKGTGTATRLRIRNNQGNGVQYNIDASGNFTLHAEDAANDNYGVEDYGNGWYRVYFETTTVNNADNFIQVYPDSQHGTGSVYIWGLQVETGSYATSYIPTYGSAVTRNREQCSENGLSALIGQTEGTIYWEGSFQDASNPILLQLAPNSGNYTSTIYFEFAGSQIRMRVYDSGTQQAYFATSASAGTQYKIALAYKENDIKGYVNGSSIGTDTLATIQSGLNNVHIGELRGSSLEAFNGSMPKQVMIFKTRLTNEELADLTTL